MSNTLKLVLTDYWFEEIKSGRKTHEYRKATLFWLKRISGKKEDILCAGGFSFGNHQFVEFQKAYRKDPERMTFEIKNIKWLSSGLETDLRCIEPVFDIELGEHIK